MLGSITFVVLGMAIILSLLGVTSLLDLHPLLPGLVIPIVTSAVAMIFALAAVRGNSWPIFITYPLPVLALLHLNAFDLVGLATVLINIGLAALAFFLIRKCVRVGQTQQTILSQSDRSD
jgi:hypothetical protein